MKIWDTIGAERFRSLRKKYHKDAQVVILAFSLNYMETFEAMDSWINEVEEKLPEPNHVKVIIGNKSDLMGQESPISG